MSPDDAVLLDVLDSARLAIQYLEGKTLEAFVRDVQLQDSVIRRLAVIGEAARRVSDEARTRHDQIPWRMMIAMRNVMVHEYDDIDPQVVWETVRDKLPGLVAILGSIVPPDA